MSQPRMNEALKAALEATSPDPKNRYQAAMIRRATAILERADAARDPEDALPTSASDLARSLRGGQSAEQLQANLKKYVEAKLAISNPDYSSDPSLAGLNED